MDHTETLTRLEQIVGPDRLVTGADMARWSTDWSGEVSWTPLAVARPDTVEEVAAILRLANDQQVPVVPVSGNTGMAGGTRAEGAVMISLDRMSRIREVRPEARIAVAEAGVILANLHEAVEAHELIFPLFFGARGSAMLGGALSTNAGGSNVLRYGNARALCLGVEVVTPTGEVMNLMSALHKDNSGYDLRDLVIGAEGTLGIITAAVVKLFPKPRAYATAMIATETVSDAVALLYELQAETGGAVEAFEYMPGPYIDAHLTRFPDARPPFDARHEVNVLVEVGAVAERDAIPRPDGVVPIAAHLERVLERAFEKGQVQDAVVAQNEAQRGEMWARREAAAELALLKLPFVDNDVAVRPDLMQELLERIEMRARALDPGVEFLNVAHLGDGNLHFAGWPSSPDPALMKAISRAVEEEVIALGGSFSAEHGVGVLKSAAMAAHKDPVALAVMGRIKAALDPNGILNPGKVIP
ncbi:FAD-binding oxidoreductase [Nioella aestuarii]|uniref:FAD-binding oxidoreductase n=1 Tax=Nioella aestuarii TaxID=1662864 RepID=UPI003D7FDA64